MVISDAPAFLFVHIPKTAGMSLRQVLSQGRPPHPLCAKGRHETAAAFVTRNGEDAFRRYFSFAVVRHPQERLLSHFAYLKSNPVQFPEMAAIQSADDYVNAIARGDAHVIRLPERVMEQWRYVSDEEGRCIVDKVYRFEQLADTLADLTQRLGTTFAPLPNKNVSDPTWKTASPAVYAFVRSYYAKDFEAFGYT